MNMRNPETKPEAVAFVSAVMKHKLVLLSPDFQTAVDLSERFDIRARDILEYRREQALRC
jgi:hypothetical protein